MTLLRAAKAALRHLPPGSPRDALRKAIQEEEARIDGKGLCEGCERSVPDRHLRYWRKFHDPLAMGLWCPACRRLLSHDRNPPAWET